jgi:hypothetical protein
MLLQRKRFEAVSAFVLGQGITVAQKMEVCKEGKIVHEERQGLKKAVTSAALKKLCPHCA